MPEQGEEQEMVVVDFVVADDLTLANVADQSAPSASPKSKIRKQDHFENYWYSSKVENWAKCQNLP